MNHHFYCSCEVLSHFSFELRNISEQEKQTIVLIRFCNQTVFRDFLPSWKHIFFKKLAIDSMSESSYRPREQAVRVVRSGAEAAVRLTEQRKSLSGKLLVSLVLKRSANWTPTPDPPSRLPACLSLVHFFQAGVPCPCLGCYHPSSSPLSRPPFDSPGLLSERCFQTDRVRTSLWWRPRHLPTSVTCSAVLWRAWALNLPVHTQAPHVHTHARTHHTCFQHPQMERWRKVDQGSV